MYLSQHSRIFCAKTKVYVHAVGMKKETGERSVKMSEVNKIHITVYTLARQFDIMVAFHRTIRSASSFTLLQL